MTAAAAATVGEALAAATDALRAAAVASPRLDAELLLADATGLGRTRLIAAPESAVDAAAGRRFAALVRRRLGREPLAYILGRKGFRRLELAVDGRVLIPRPESELLVEVARELRPGAVLDVGTGSGALALAVADELPEARVVATDASLDALAVAKANSRRLGFADRVRFELGCVPPGERFDLVLANLPYVREDEWPALAPEIKGFEPREAVVAGPTGLEAIESLLRELALAELPSVLALELGDGQAATVAELMRRTGFERTVVRRDLARVERVVVGWA